jgi:hypothetical protein
MSICDGIAKLLFEDIQDPDKLKDKIINDLNEMLNNEIKSIDWNENGENGEIIEYGGCFNIKNRIIEKSKIQIENEREKYINEMIRIFQEIDKLHSDRAGKSKQQIDEENNCVLKEVFILNINISNITYSDKEREVFLEMFKSLK